MFCDIKELSRDGGVESVKGSSEDIALSDVYRSQRLVRAVAWWARERR